MTTPHPLEEALGIEPGSSFPEATKNAPATALRDPKTGEELVRTDMPSDEELQREERLDDLAIDKKLEQVHAAAMDAFSAQQEIIDGIDPRYAARNAEVAAQYLNIALNSINGRVDAKFKRNKIRIASKEAVAAAAKGQGGGTILVADRNAILRALGGGQEPQHEKEVKGEVLPLEETKE